MDMTGLTHQCLRVPLEIDTFHNNFDIENELTKYLKESSQHCFINNISPSNAFLVMLFNAGFHQNQQAAFEPREH